MPLQAPLKYQANKKFGIAVCAVRFENWVECIASLQTLIWLALRIHIAKFQEFCLGNIGCSDVVCISVLRMALSRGFRGFQSKSRITKLHNNGGNHVLVSLTEFSKMDTSEMADNFQHPIKFNFGPCVDRSEFVM